MALRRAGVEITGGKELRRAFKAAGKDAQKDLRALQKKVATVVKDDVDVPFKSGNLTKTLRATGAASKATVKLGGKRAPYGRINHWRKSGTLYMFEAADENRQEAMDVFFDGITEIMDRHGIEI